MAPCGSGCRNPRVGWIAGDWEWGFGIGHRSGDGDCISCREKSTPDSVTWGLCDVAQFFCFVRLLFRIVQNPVDTLS